MHGENKRAIGHKLKNKKKKVLDIRKIFFTHDDSQAVMKVTQCTFLAPKGVKPRTTWPELKDDPALSRKLD